MRIYFHTSTQHILMAPAKSGSSTLEQMLQKEYYWDNIFLGKPVTDPQNLLLDYIDPWYIKNSRVFVIVRNPVDWIISGFRYMQYQNIVDPSHVPYPNNLKDHLISIKNNLIEDPFWKLHCLHQPADFLRTGYRFFKLEDFKLVLRYLDKNCNSEYRKLDNYNVNKNNSIPYPVIGDFEKSVILDLTRKAAILTGYDIEKSIEDYRAKYNQGEGNEFSVQNV